MTPRLPERDSMPPSPGPAGRHRDNRGNGATLLGLVFFLLAGMGLFALICMALPFPPQVLLVPVGVIGFFALHYYTWGRWLSRTLKDHEEQDQRQDPKP